MFSAASEAVHGSIIESVLGLTSKQADSTPPDALPDPPRPSYQQDLTQELDDLEHQFTLIHSPPFNYDTLQFRPGFELLDTASPDTILDALLPAIQSTNRFIYRINGLKHLVNELRSLQEEHGLPTTGGASPADMTRCESLLATVNIELDGLLAMARLCYHERNELYDLRLKEGLKSYRFTTPYSTGRVLPAVVMAATLPIAIVHSLMQVGRENCNAILAILRSILQLAFKAQELRTQSYLAANIDTIPINLSTALTYLGLPTQLDIYVTCPKCSHLYLLNDSVPDSCSATSLSGGLCGKLLFKRRSHGNKSWRQPIRRYSHQRLEVWLSKLLCRPGIEDLLEQAHPTPQKTRVADFLGAPFLASFPETEEASFFDAPNSELRLVFMVYHNFFNPYTNKTAGKKHSTGMIMMVCLNLPPEVRYNHENVYLAAVIPGPSLPGEDRINNFIRPIADNLEEHFRPGVWIARTAKHRNGRKIRSVAPITSMDVPASRDWGGLGSHSHTFFCSFCLITLFHIDVFTPGAFPNRTMDQHYRHVARWKAAKSTKNCAEVWSEHGARYSEWLRFPWWTVFTGTTIAPMHWIKNILEKHLRENMDWSWSVPAGIPEPSRLKPITVLEQEWGRLALQYSSADSLQLSELLLRHLCRQHGIYETGLPSARMIADLNQLRLRQGIIGTDGAVINRAPRLCIPGSDMNASKANAVTLAKSEWFLSRATKPSLLLNNSSLDDLFLLCAKFNLPYNPTNTKAQLANLLLAYYKDIRVATAGEGNSPPQKPISWLGKEVLQEIKGNIELTSIPSWLKAPPKEFATISHGKIGAEEYKSLALVSFTITLIRLWGRSISESDVQTFEHHYTTYLNGVKKLYPTCSVVPTQHFGLHIPYFLRAFGPGTRFNENPAEMFIGMLQEFPTNWKLDDLGITIHNEFNMAADLQGLLQDQSILTSIGEVGTSINHYIDTRFPGRQHTPSKGWTTNHESWPFRLSDDAYNTYSAWAASKGVIPITRHQLLCSKLQKGSLVYQPHSHSVGNSHILFRARASSTPLPGRIESILMEPSQAVPAGGTPRITVLVLRFQPLSRQDQFYDPYSQHPIVGASGYDIIQLCYEKFDPSAFIIEPDDIICHLARCDFDDVEEKLSAPCVVLVSLDLKHTI